MGTKHKVIFANCMSMIELADNAVNLIVTSPPYFNAPFDYKGLFESYEQYLGVLKKMAKESYRGIEIKLFGKNSAHLLYNHRLLRIEYSKKVSLYFFA